TRVSRVTLHGARPIEVGPDRVTVPESLLKDLDSELLPPGHRGLLLQRVDEFNATVNRLSALHLETRRRFQEESAVQVLQEALRQDRKSTRLTSSHVKI